MTSKERCGEIIRLIDMALAAPPPPAPVLAGPERRPPSRRPAERR